MSLCGPWDKTNPPVRSYLVVDEESRETSTITAADRNTGKSANSRKGVRGAGWSLRVGHRALLVQELELRALALEDLVAGVVLAAHGDDLALGGHHLEEGDVVDGGACLLYTSRCV